jgi:hypothetical protein
MTCKRSAENPESLRDARALLAPEHLNERLDVLRSSVPERMNGLYVCLAKNLIR